MTKSSKSKTSEDLSKVSAWLSRRIRVKVPTQAEMDALSVEKRLELIDQRRQGWHRVLGGFGTSLSILIAVASLIVTALYQYRGREGQTETINTTQEGQIREQYVKAVDLLGSKDRNVRLGAIYALQRVAADSPRDRPVIVAMLATYVREHDYQAGVRKLPFESEAEVRAAITVLASQPHSSPELIRGDPIRDPGGIHARLLHESPSRFELHGIQAPGIDLVGVDLSGVDLHGAKMVGAHLYAANFYRADLYASSLEGADLQGVMMNEANLRNSTLDFARLFFASLYRTEMAGARLRFAKLGGANLVNAIMYSSDLRFAFMGKANLRGADLSDADLRGAYLGDTDLRGASLHGARFGAAKFKNVKLGDTILDGADLRGADLTSVRGISVSAIKRHAITDFTTRF